MDFEKIKNENKKCIYCKENMTYGQHIQVMCNNISKYKSVKYIIYGWGCSMKNDECDIVLDEKDFDRNKLSSDEAYKKLLT